MDNIDRDFLETIGFSNEPDKTCALGAFVEALAFVRDNELFSTIDMQKTLCCKYTTAIKVIDALLALCVVEKTEQGAYKYQRCVDSDVIGFCSGNLRKGKHNTI